ncbi:AraC family transcriptional regulator [Nisaea sp.]|uniref:AraC family transcriptional regulator n=1 Tax=Nisaea sp. TaxID=2024842 RepID=UPI003B51F142
MQRKVCLAMESQKSSSNGQSSPIRAALDALPPEAPQILAFGTFFAEGHDTGLHHHDRAQFVHAESGLLRVWSAEGNWSVPPGMAVWVPAGVPHRVHAISDANFLSLYIRAPRDGEPDIAIPDRCAVVSITPLLKQLIIRLRDRLGRSGPDRYRRLASVIADELGDLAPADLHLPVPFDRRAARVAVALIADPSDARELSDWAREAGASGRTLTRIFMRETGLSFSEWRQRCRLIGALERLSAGRSITDVAFSCGYRSPSAFSAAFSKAFGTAPRHFLRSARDV